MVTSESAVSLPNGVMFNAYPDSIGEKLSDAIALLEKPELKGAFSLFYILPTFFNSDLDRGFSIIDYNINDELVSTADLEALSRLNILLKFDLVLNHLSVGSPQFQDMLRNGDASEYKDFFIDWNEFWKGEGEMSSEGHILPKEEHLQKLFMRKPGLPILRVRFPDGTERPYWNTFYQQIDYHCISLQEVSSIPGIAPEIAEDLVEAINQSITEKRDYTSCLTAVDESAREAIAALVEQKRTYLGQMDLNANSEKVWQFYDETFAKLKGYGATLIRLDAFAYLHKQPGMVNFFNKPETWNYLSRLREMADRHGLELLPEIHSEYGAGLYEEVAGENFPIYDFFFPGLVIDAIDRACATPLIKWMNEILSKNLITINMLGCHDGIPVLDLRGRAGKQIITDDEIEDVVSRVLERGGRVKNLYGPDGKKIAYYQVNATFFSALGEDERKLLLARAIQMFMPGIPQVWYLDLFAGKNNYAAADSAGAAGHKEINRTTISVEEAELGLSSPIVQNQLFLMRLRNTSKAFKGQLEIHKTQDSRLHLTWSNGLAVAELDADLATASFRVVVREPMEEQKDSSELKETVFTAP
jgi:sucrose phosphorylase